jgi:diguanylate cyclase (GGDEF)-like protein
MHAVARRSGGRARSFKAEMDWHRRRQIIASLFAAGIILLAVMAAATLVIDHRTVEDGTQLSKIRGDAEAANELLVALIDIETGVRGYVIAGDPTYLEPFYRGRNTVIQIEEQLGSAFEAWAAPGYSDQPLGKLIEVRGKLMNDVLETARADGIGVAQIQLRDSNAKQLMDRMRLVIAHKLAELANESDTMERHANLLTSIHAILIVATLTLAIAFSIAQFMLFRNEVQGRGAIEQTLRRRNEERRQVADLSSALQLSDSRREAYGIIEAYARRIMVELSGAFYVYTASRDQLTRVAQWNLPGATQAFAEHLQPSDCWGLRQGGRHIGCAEPMGGPDTDAAPLTCRHIDGEIGPYTCIPIVGRGQILGMLHLRGEALRKKESRALLDGMIERLVDQLSLSLTNIELREKLENMALRDGLTGLYNRRFLDEVLEHNLSKLKRESKHAGLLLLDVDHFKRFNDTHGHQAGDEALRRVGAALTAAVRASDVVCRYGGEEFLVFLPECDRAEAATKAEAIRVAISQTALSVGNQPIPPVTVSIGLAMFPEAGTTRAQLIQMADRALYRAKGAGRNRVVAAEPMGLVPSDETAPAQAAK